MKENMELLSCRCFSVFGSESHDRCVGSSVWPMLLRPECSAICEIFAHQISVNPNLLRNPKWIIFWTSIHSAMFGRCGLNQFAVTLDVWMPSLDWVIEEVALTIRGFECIPSKWCTHQTTRKPPEIQQTQKKDH